MIAALTVLLASPLLAQAQQTEGSDLGQLYRRARTQALAERLATEKARTLTPMPLRTPRLDSLRAWLAPEAAAPEEEPLAPLPRIRERHVVRRLERPVFKRRFANVRWAYLGANGRTVLDTMQTRALRARLQALYGDPTRTAVDADSLPARPASAYVQFEYWFTANGAIPIKVVDTGGPFDRGLVFAAPARFRERLGELRAAFFTPLAGTSLRAAYVDHYYDADTQTWYRTGYDGQRFFTAPVPRSDVVPGRRPALQRAP